MFLTPKDAHFHHNIQHVEWWHRKQKIEKENKSFTDYLLLLSTQQIQDNLQTNFEGKFSKIATC